MATGSQVLHQDIIDNISSGVIGLDQDLRVRLMNPAAEALLQLSEARLLDRPISDLDSSDLPWRPTLEQSARDGRAVVRRGLAIDTRDGKPIITDMIITPLSEGGRLAFLIELQPVDRLMRINREESLISSQQATSAVVRGLAHEVKNPLGGIRGAAQLLGRELPDGPLQEYTGIIIQEADRLRDLVDRLLGPHVRQPLADINVHEILEHVVQLISVEAGDRLVLRRDYDPSLPTLEGDRAQLIQAVLNVMRNAVEASAEQPRCDMTLRTRSQRQFTIGDQRHRLVCRIDICDQGPGIPPELQETLFVPMVSGRPEGSGLGLAIAQSIVQRHGGLLTCDSKPGDTCFIIYLPMEE